jgi:hypothetical protein
MNQVGSRVFCFPFHIGKGPTFGSTSHFGMLHTAAIFSFSLEQLLHTSYVPTGGLNLIALPCVARIPQLQTWACSAAPRVKGHREVGGRIILPSHF